MLHATIKLLDFHISCVMDCVMDKQRGKITEVHVVTRWCG